jgi:sugar lactone lactonase YvrE
MYVTGLTYDGIIEIDLATPYYINPNTDGSADINDLKYISLDTLSIQYENSSKTEQIGDNILSLEWGDNGRKLYVLEGYEESIIEFHVTSSVPYNIHALKPVNRLNLNADDTHISNIVFTPDGSHLLFAESTKDNIYQYDLKKNWDIRTAELSHKTSITGSNRRAEGVPSSFVFKPNFSEMFLIGTTYDEIERFRNDNFFSSSNEQFNIRSGETNIYGDLTVHGALSLPAAKQFEIQDELRITSGLNALSSSLITKNITGEMPIISVDSVNYIGSASLDGGPAGDSGQYPSTPASLRFTPDGYTFYLLDRNSTEYIYKYSLKKPFEILTDFDDIKGPSITKVGRLAISTVLTSLGSARSFRFNFDGSKVFFSDITTDGLVEAPLENPYDVLSMYNSGVKYMDLNLVPGSPDDPNSPQDFQFRPDGLELFVIDYGDDVINVYEVTGSNAYDIHALKWKYQWTPSYVNRASDSSFSFEINQQGSEMLFVGNNNDLFQYSLKKPWDLRTARTKGYLFNISGSGETSPLSVNYKPDQSGFFIVGSTLDKIQIFDFVETGSLDLNMSPTTISGKLKVREGNLQLDSGLIESTQPLKSNFGFDGASGSMDIGVINNPLRLPSSSSFHVFSGSFSSGTQNIYNFNFRPDGREIYYLDTSNDRIYYDNFLDKPFDIRTLTDVYGNLERYVSTSGEGSPKDFAVSSTGKHVYVIGGIQDGISQYQLTGSAFEIGSLDLEKTMDLNLVDGVRSGDFTTLNDPRHIFIRPDNRRAYVSFYDTYNGSGNGLILQFDCTASSDHFDAGALRVTGRLFDGRGNTSSKISFNDVGTQLFLFGDTTEEFELYDLNTPWDITTANFVETLDAGQIAVAKGVRGSSGTYAGQFYKDSFYVISSLVSGAYRHPIIQITPNKEHPIIDGFGFNGESGSINPIEMGGTVNIRGELQVGRRLNVMGDISQSLTFPTTASFNHVIGTSFAGDGASLTNVPDYVYEPTYDLKSINELEEYVFNNKHLPNVPDMNDFKKWKNLSVGDRDMLLLEKIEELSLYIIELNKRIEKLENK